MSKQNALTVVISIVLSVGISVATNYALDPHRQTTRPDEIQAKRVELIDDQGRVRGAFELVSDGANGVMPQLVMSGPDGGSAIQMVVDRTGNGALGFRTKHWNEGLSLGHINPAGSESTGQQIKDGGWGIQIRSPQGNYTGIGFSDSGKAIVPISEDAKR
jgi:hypothetical protein